MENNMKDEKTLEELLVELENARVLYDTLKDIINKKETEEAERKKAELIKQKETRKKEIKTKEKELNELRTKFLEDYGSLTITTNNNDDSWLSAPAKHYFSF